MWNLYSTTVLNIITHSDLTSPIGNVYIIIVFGFDLNIIMQVKINKLLKFIVVVVNIVKLNKFDWLSIKRH